MFGFGANFFQFKIQDAIPIFQLPEMPVSLPARSHG